MAETAGQTMTMQRFVGYREQVPEHYIEGGYGNAGTEPQYEGVVFSDGTVVLRWLTEYRSTSVWSSFDEMEKVHGHPDYGTRIEWLEEGPITELRGANAEIDMLRHALTEARTELARWGWGDHHYGDTPQEQSVVDALAKIDTVLAYGQGSEST